MSRNSLLFAGALAGALVCSVAAHAAPGVMTDSVKLRADQASAIGRSRTYQPARSLTSSDAAGGVGSSMAITKDL